MNFKTVIYNLNNSIPFTFARFGLGEWECMLGAGVHDINGTPYSDSLKLSLQFYLKSPLDSNEYIGIQNLAVKNFPKQTEAIIKKYGLNFCNSDLFAMEWYNNSLSDFFLSLDRYSVYLIAPDYYKELQVRNHWSYCRIDRHDWHGKNFQPLMELVKLQLSIMVRTETNPILILWVAGLGAKPAMKVVRELYPHITQIDIGSALDPYTGYATRKYHSLKDPSLNKLTK